MKPSMLTTDRVPLDCFSVDRPFSTGGQLMCHEEMHHQMPILLKILVLQAVFGPTLIFVLGISAPLRGLIM
jgi:hypothetical protein